MGSSEHKLIAFDSDRELIVLSLACRHRRKLDTTKKFLFLAPADIAVCLRRTWLLLSRNESPRSGHSDQSVSILPPIWYLKYCYERSSHVQRIS